MNDLNIDGNLDKMKQYGAMAKNFMNKPFNHPNDIVGNYEWHQKFPYEQFLLNKKTWSYEREEYVLTPLFPESKNDLVAVDFGCGPGRMIYRMDQTNKFKRIDGIDVSDYALAYAKTQCDGSNFYSSSGYDVGDAPSDTYDLVYSTIALQHIACRSIRTNLYKEFSRILKEDGQISLQLAFHPTLQAGKWSHDTHHVHYMSDAFDATATNGHADFILNLNSLDDFRNDLSSFFKDVNITFFEVQHLYANLNGAYHSNYWPSHWIFVNGTNNGK